MASYDGNILIKTQVDTSGIKSGTSNITTALSGMSGSFKSLGKAAIAAFAVSGLVKFGKEAVNLASDLEEVQNVVNVAFGSMSYKIEEFSQKSIEMYGISELAAKKTASTYMAMAKSMGLSMETASDMSINLTALSADMASFYNVTQDVADTALKSVFTGETETLKNYGIVMTEANLKQFALSKGITKSYSAMTQAEKVMLRYNYVIQQTGLAQGDFARTSNSWANQTKLLSENWKEFLSLVGEGLIKVLIPLVKALNAILESINKVIKFITKSKGETENYTDAVYDQVDAQDDLTSSIAGTTKALDKELASFDTVERLFNNFDGFGGGGGIGDLLDIADIKLGDLQEEEEKKTYLVWEWKPELPNIMNIGTKLLWFFNPAIPLAINILTKLNWEWFPKKVEAPDVEPMPDPVYEPNWGLQPSFAEELEPLPQMLTDGLPVLPDPVYEPNWNLSPTFASELNAMSLNLKEWAPIFAENFMKLLDNLNFNTIIGLNAINSNYNSFFETVYQNERNWIIAMGVANEVLQKNLVDNGNEGIKTYVGNFVNGLQTMWENFKEWAASVGQAILSVFTSDTFIKVTAGAGLTLMAVGGLLAAAPTLGASLSATAAGLSGLGAMAIPALANGAVIPPNKEFLAVLGDQKSGLNIEAPLETMLQAFRQANAEDRNSGELTADITLYINGEVLYNEQQKIAMRRGNRLVKGGNLV